MNVTQDRWSQHSFYRGVKVLKRVKGSGTAGGAFLALHCSYKTLRNLKNHIDYMWKRDPQGMESEFSCCPKLL